MPGPNRSCNGSAPKLNYYYNYSKIMPTMQAYISDKRFRAYQDWLEAWGRKLNVESISLGELIVTLSNDKKFWPKEK